MSIRITEYSQSSYRYSVIEGTGLTQSPSGMRLT